MILQGHLDRAGLNRDEAHQTAGMQRSLAEERHKVQGSAELREAALHPLPAKEVLSQVPAGHSVRRRRVLLEALSMEVRIGWDIYGTLSLLRESAK
jgi:hypothetical protein